jgi:hypothetical protein
MPTMRNISMYMNEEEPICLPLSAMIN